MTRYQYDPQTQAEVEHMARLAIPGRVRLTRATRAEDFGGIDVMYTVNGACPLQIRVRLDRPAFAADIDVTFRHTEPAMIGAGTYAPLALFVWIRQGWAVAGKLIDIYRMADRVQPALRDRAITPNGDGTGFLAVRIAELVDAGALLRQGDRNEWAAAVLGGNERTRRIVDHRTRVAAS